MRQYAVDLAADGIRSNAVNADRIRTGLFEGGVLESRAKARGVTVEEYFRANLLSREVTASDVGDAFVYLAGARATSARLRGHRRRGQRRRLFRAEDSKPFR